MPTSVDFEIAFRTPEQREYYCLTQRNSCFSGGFGNGKTYIACKKIVSLMLTFPGYRVAIARYEESKLKETTMKTFFKPDLCPPACYAPENGGNRADSLNRCTFFNKSEVIWINLKDADEGFVRGLEVNSVLIDQAEEISEHMYLLLSARVGRWDQAVVPEKLLIANPNWPVAKNTRKPSVPNYMMILCNPDSELHWIYRRYHPESEDFQKKFNKNHIMIQGETTSATIGEELLEEMNENDPAWVQRFVKGKWGIPGGAIHTILDDSILIPGTRPEGVKGVSIDLDFVNKIIERGNLSRVLDHGDSAPTCCLWFAAYKDWYFCFREYYKPDALVSAHRKNIAGLSGNERYSLNLADPQIFKKQSQKYGGRWCTADEYLDKQIDAPPIYFEPADNDEGGTRNRISELLRRTRGVKHPITGEDNAPKLYFILRTPEYPNGSYFAQSQLKSQKRKKIGTVDGKDIFSDDRDDNVTDHSYDCVRYYCASHANSPSIKRPKAPANSFYSMRKMLLHRKNFGNIAHA